MKNTLDLTELQAVLNVLNMESLNTPVVDSEGFSVETIDLLGDDKEAKFIRLKSFLMSVCKNETQTNIIELLSQEYDVEYVANKLNYSREYIRRVIREIRNRCLRLLKKSK